MDTLEQAIFTVNKALYDNGFIVTIEKPIDYGHQFRLASGGVINVYKSGKVIVQGKPCEKLKTLFGGGK